MAEEKTVSALGQLTKKCPFCMGYVPLNATACQHCGKKVGRVDEQGIARVPVDWPAYLKCLAAFAALGLFIWWAFFE
jgi:hypothetical protein